MRSIAICLGGATTVWDDLAAARVLVGEKPHVIVACNYAGIAFEGHLDAWVTLHPDKLPDWRRQRLDRGGNADYRTFTHRSRPSPDCEIVAKRFHGSSGLYMAQVALEVLGAAGAILCGVPMDDTGGHIHWGEWSHAYHYQNGFRAAHKVGLPIRSMSGWTRAGLFGAPDEDWLKSIWEDAGMAWVIFEQAFEWSPTRLTLHAHAPSPEPRCVTEACAAAAVKVGKARRVATPNRSERLQFVKTSEDGA